MADPLFGGSAVNEVDLIIKDNTIISPLIVSSKDSL